MLDVVIALLCPWLLCFSSMIKFRIFLFCRNVDSLVDIILINRLVVFIMFLISRNSFLLRRRVLKNLRNSRICNRMFFAIDRIYTLFYVVFFLFSFTFLFLFTFKIFMRRQSLFTLWLFLLWISFIGLEHWVLSSFLKL